MSTETKARGGLLRRLLVAQESGLILVITFIMALLSLFSGSMSQRQRFDVPAGSTIDSAEGPVIRITTPQGEMREYPTSDGWELRGEPAALFRTTQANKFLNLENLMQVLVFASFIAIMAVGITAVIVMGGIDLSIGSTYALAALIGALALRYPWAASGWPGPSLMGSGTFWNGACFAGLGMLVALGIWKLRSTHANRSTAASGKVMGTLGWMALGLVLVCMPALLSALHTTGKNVESGMIPRSAMGPIGSIAIGLAACIGVGALCGWLNGKMIVGLKVHPFIITLGTMAAYRGITALPTDAQSVGNFPESFTRAIKMDFSGITPVPVIIMLLVCLGGVFVLSRTVLGRQVYAIGGNETAATYAGIPVQRVKITVYAVMGAMAGLAAFVYLGYFGGAEPAAGTGYELKAIAAAVIGGASLSGGRGSALGAVLGAILVQLIDNAMVMLRVDQSYNQVVLGGAIIVAVLLDGLKTRLVPHGR